MRTLYNIGIFLYWLGLQVASPFYGKARKLARGQRGALRKLEAAMALRNGRQVVWMHCASLGEFEQGRPILEQLRRERPNTFILLSFFSPSGYEVRKSYAGVDYVCYLPLDLRRNARRFVHIAAPSIAIFVKYELWYNYLQTLHQQGVKTYVVSAIFREQQAFFDRAYGNFFVQMLRWCEHIFVQNRESLRLLAEVDVHNASLAGDTRFDRVLEVATNANTLPELSGFAASSEYTLVAGSTWPADEALLAELVNNTPDLKLIIAPHEVSESRVRSLIALFKRPALRYSQWRHSKPTELASYQIFVVDAIGFLSSLYRFGHAAYVGGGFGVGIHNTLEAAVFGIPVFFGPNYQRFGEACDLVQVGGAFCVQSTSDLVRTVGILRTNPACYQAACNASRSYVEQHAGATGRVMRNLKI
ncbi:MAG: 3-deoxy-D-manno-octulosonic acid transferase [Prevotellaceae bacterium]|jgi:3-deoxy-D-manno-octulosonic-acid transferase|nr:3-deoxy-D-manno-octulosonic acid transferase [Prevotellaceae bacterium]